MDRFLFIGGPHHGHRLQVERGSDVCEVALPSPVPKFDDVIDPRALMTADTARYHRVIIRASGVRDSQWTVYTYQRRWAEWEILGHLLDTFPEKAP